LKVMVPSWVSIPSKASFIPTYPLDKLPTSFLRSSLRLNCPFEAHENPRSFAEFGELLLTFFLPFQSLLIGTGVAFEPL